MVTKPFFLRLRCLYRCTVVLFKHLLTAGSSCSYILAVNTVRCFSNLKLIVIILCKGVHLLIATMFLFILFHFISIKASTSSFLCISGTMSSNLVAPAHLHSKNTLLFYYITAKKKTLGTFKKICVLISFFPIFYPFNL